jgi:hypothetical protein
MLHEATLKNAPPFFLGSVVRLLLEANHLHERRGRGKSRAKKKRLRRKGGEKGEGKDSSLFFRFLAFFLFSIPSSQPRHPHSHESLSFHRNAAHHVSVQTRGFHPSHSLKCPCRLDMVLGSPAGKLLFLLRAHPKAKGTWWGLSVTVHHADGTVKLDRDVGTCFHATCPGSATVLAT